jgi:tetratricopeptide (TPR) repeat protein
MMRKFMIFILAAAVLSAGCHALKKEHTIEVPKTVSEQTKFEKDAKSAYDKGDYIETIGLLKALLKKDPKNAVYWGQLGSSYAQLDEFNYSIYAYQNAITFDPRNVKAMYNLSVIYGEKGNSSAAKDVLAKALKIEPKNPLLQASLGNVLIDEQKYDKAKVLYERIVDVKPDFDIAHFNLGVINFEERNLDESKKNYEAVLQLKPGDYEAKENLAAIAILQEDFAGAVSRLKEVIDSNPADDITLENAYYNMGVAYLRMKNYKASLDAFETAINIEPWDMAAYVNAAIISEQLGFKDKAVKYWKKYDHLLPVNKRKEEMAKHLKKLGATMDVPAPEPQDDTTAASADAEATPEPIKTETKTGK